MCTSRIASIRLTKHHIFAHIFCLSKSTDLYNREYLSESHTFRFIGLWKRLNRLVWQCHQQKRHWHS